MSDDQNRSFLTFRIGNEDYAIDILKVREIREVERVTHIAGAPAYVNGIINLRGVTISKELVLGLWLALESSAGEIERARILLRDVEDANERAERVDLLLGKAWLRIENARRALDETGTKAE